jgi:hypothetical protein
MSFVVLSWPARFINEAARLLYSTFIFAFSRLALETPLQCRSIGVTGGIVKVKVNQFNVSATCIPSTEHLVVVMVVVVVSDSDSSVDPTTAIDNSGEAYGRLLAQRLERLLFNLIYKDQGQSIDSVRWAHEQ